jgi:hypothetical protein
MYVHTVRMEAIIACRTMRRESQCSLLWSSLYLNKSPRNNTYQLDCVDTTQVLTTTECVACRKRKYPIVRVGITVVALAVSLPLKNMYYVLHPLRSFWTGKCLLNKIKASFFLVRIVNFFEP